MMQARRRGPVEIVERIASEESTITVRRRGEAHEVLFDGRVLMASDAAETEEAFGRMAGNLVFSTESSVLVGGLGFGFTLRGVLSSVGPSARVVVVERVGRIIELCRGALRDLAGDPLSDPRVVVVQGPIQQLLGHLAASDVILLDLDNGPHWATFRENGWLYSDAGVRFLSRALKPGGSLAVWSGYPARPFLRTLRRANLEAREVPLSVRGRVRARAFIGRHRR